MTIAIRTLMLFCCAILLMRCEERPPTDPVNAAYDRRCQAGDGASCYQLALYHESKRQPSSASAAYEQACKAGHLEGCRAGGYFIASSERINPDYRRAAELHRKACNGSLADSCTQLGWMYESGQIPRSTDRAIRLYRKGCDGQDGVACALLGERYRDGKHVTRNRGTAASFFRKGCTYQNADACTALAEQYAVGSGVRRDASKAAELLQKGCSLGNKLACAVAEPALLTRSGDPSRTKTAWTRLAAAARPARALFRRPPRDNAEAIERLENVGRTHAAISCTKVDAELTGHIQSWPRWTARAAAFCAADERRQKQADGIETFAGLVGATVASNESGDRDEQSLDRGRAQGQRVGRQIAGAVVGQTSARDAHSVGGEGAALLRNQEVLRMRLQVRYGITLPPVRD